MRLRAAICCDGVVKAYKLVTEKQVQHGTGGERKQVLYKDLFLLLPAQVEAPGIGGHSTSDVSCPDSQGWIGCVLPTDIQSTDSGVLVDVFCLRCSINGESACGHLWLSLWASERSRK